jgi:hypothetical protein
MDDLLRRWREWRDDLTAALAQMHDGKLGAGTNNVDSTRDSVILLHAKVAELDKSIEQYGAGDPKGV